MTCVSHAVDKYVLLFYFSLSKKVTERFSGKKMLSSAITWPKADSIFHSCSLILSFECLKKRRESGMGDKGGGAVHYSSNSSKQTCN